MNRKVVINGCRFDWDERDRLWVEAYRICDSEVDRAALVAFIQAGPPKKKYRITRTFDDLPGYVATGPRFDPIWVDIEDKDMEETYE